MYITPNTFIHLTAGKAAMVIAVKIFMANITKYWTKTGLPYPC
jgi:hypothetical protein